MINFYTTQQLKSLGWKGKGYYEQNGSKSKGLWVRTNASGKPVSYIDLNARIKNSNGDYIKLNFDGTISKLYDSKTGKVASEVSSSEAGMMRKGYIKDVDGWRPEVKADDDMDSWIDLNYNDIINKINNTKEGQEYLKLLKAKGIDPNSDFDQVVREYGSAMYKQFSKDASVKAVNKKPYIKQSKQQKAITVNYNTYQNKVKSALAKEDKLKELESKVNNLNRLNGQNNKDNKAEYEAIKQKYIDSINKRLQTDKVGFEKEYNAFVSDWNKQHPKQPIPASFTFDKYIEAAKNAFTYDDYLQGTVDNVVRNGNKVSDVFAKGFAGLVAAGLTGEAAGLIVAEVAPTVAGRLISNPRLASRVLSKNINTLANSSNLGVRIATVAGKHLVVNPLVAAATNPISTLGSMVGATATDIALKNYGKKKGILKTDSEGKIIDDPTTSKDGWFKFGTWAASTAAGGVGDLVGNSVALGLTKALTVSGFNNFKHPHLGWLEDKLLNSYGYNIFNNGFSTAALKSNASRAAATTTAGAVMAGLLYFPEKLLPDNTVGNYIKHYYAPYLLGKAATVSGERFAELSSNGADNPAAGAKNVLNAMKATVLSPILSYKLDKLKNNSEYGF